MNPTDDSRTGSKPLLLDASVWIAAVDPDDRFHSSAAKLAVAEEQTVAGLDLSLYEVANALGARDGEQRRARHLARLIFLRCGEELLRVDRDLFEAAVEVAAEHGLTAYDAAYVAATRQYGMALVSADVRDLVSKDLAVTPDDALGGALYP